MTTNKLKPSDVNHQEDNGPFAAKPDSLRCGFCYDREQGKHGDVKREWSPEWLQYIPVCRKHAIADGMDKAGSLIGQIIPDAQGISND